MAERFAQIKAECDIPSVDIERRLKNAKFSNLQKEQQKRKLHQAGADLYCLLLIAIDGQE